MKDFYVTHAVVVVNTPDQWSRETGRMYARKVVQRGPGLSTPTPPRKPTGALLIFIGVVMTLGLIQVLAALFSNES